MQLRQFLVHAKIATYATQGEANEINLDDGAKELTYQEGGYRYRDRYYGFSPFVGEEIVWQNNKIIWSMNYYGKLTSDATPAKEVYTFLQEALRQVKEDRPYRGPGTFRRGDFSYADKSSGSIDAFSGIEKILHKGQEIYVLQYHGGFVKFR